MNILLKIKNKYPVYKTDTPTLKYNYMNLKNKLSADDKKLLLRIIDGKDLLIETAAYENFEYGFCMGIQMASKDLK